MEILLQKLIELDGMYEKPVAEVCTFAMETAIAQTQSKIGYIAFLNESETILHMHAWSKSAMEECSILDKKQIYPVETTGLWGEAVRQRKAIITNDYANAPLKKGIPEGHCKLIRHMNVPIIDGGRIVVVAGVGNKETDYDEIDAKKLTLFMEGMWKHLKRSKEKMQLEQKLGRSEELVREILDLIPVGLFWKDENNRYLGCNLYHAKEAGVDKPEDLIGKTDEELSWASAMEKFYKDNNKVIQEGIPLLNIDEYYIANGKKKWLQANKLPMKDEKGNVCGVVCCWQDVTTQKQLHVDELKNAIDDLKRSNSELEKFAYVASHDLKAPLRAITNLVSWILEDQKEGKDVSKYTIMLNKRINRMEALINGLLEYSRIGRVYTDKVEMNLAKIISDIKEDLNGEKHQNVHINVSSKATSVTLRTNEMRINQVFYNLVENAIKHHHHPENINIDISCIERDKEYEFCVCDDGPGIDPKFHDKIFEIFQTLKPKDEVDGTGIGLALVKKIIEDHKGKIWVVSELGKGTKFCFTIPK